MPVYIRKPRILNLSGSRGAHSSAQLLRQKDVDETDTVPTRDTGTSSVKTIVAKGMFISRTWHFSSAMDQIYGFVTKYLLVVRGKYI